MVSRPSVPGADDRDPACGRPGGRRAPRSRSARPSRPPRRSASSGTATSWLGWATISVDQPPPVDSQKPVCRPGSRWPKAMRSHRLMRPARALLARRVDATGGAGQDRHEDDPAAVVEVAHDLVAGGEREARRSARSSGTTGRRSSPGRSRRCRPAGAGPAPSRGRAARAGRRRPATAARPGRPPGPQRPGDHGGRVPGRLPLEHEGLHRRPRRPGMVADRAEASVRRTLPTSQRTMLGRRRSSHRRRVASRRSPCRAAHTSAVGCAGAVRRSSGPIGSGLGGAGGLVPVLDQPAPLAGDGGQPGLGVDGDGEADGLEHRQVAGRVGVGHAPRPGRSRWPRRSRPAPSARVSPVGGTSVSSPR